MHFYVTLDGVSVYGCYPPPVHPLLDDQLDCASVAPYPGMHQVCLGMDDPVCVTKLGDAAMTRCRPS